MVLHLRLSRRRRMLAKGEHPAQLISSTRFHLSSVVLIILSYCFLYKSNYSERVVLSWCSGQTQLNNCVHVRRKPPLRGAHHHVAKHKQHFLIGPFLYVCCC